MVVISLFVFFIGSRKDLFTKSKKTKVTSTFEEADDMLFVHALEQVEEELPPSYPNPTEEITDDDLLYLNTLIQFERELRS